LFNVNYALIVEYLAFLGVFVSCWYIYIWFN